MGTRPRQEAPGAGLRLRCPRCGPVEVDRCLVERYLDPTCGFGFATFLCPSCGELGTTTCPTALGTADLGSSATVTLRCTSPPRTAHG